jgi:hypothetical protein
MSKYTGQIRAAINDSRISAVEWSKYRGIYIAGDLFVSALNRSLLLSCSLIVLEASQSVAQFAACLAYQTLTNTKNIGAKRYL